MTGPNTQQELVCLLQIELAHLWMIRTFLKHADEIQEDAEMLEVPRTLFDVIRATEPAFLSGDWARYLHKLRGKWGKLESARDYYLAHFKEFSDHTNFTMAAASLEGSVQKMKGLLTGPGQPG
ncbi:MAG: hypothetical protein EXS11_06365 [Gemmataceae bacterium]|nr:hypothetical protein [Gemmataceae bacterium]